MEICSYQDAHFDGIDALWREAFPDDPPWNAAGTAIPEKQDQQDDLIVVALDQGNVIGSIIAGYDGHRGWLYAVAVLKSHRKQGIGTALVQEAERRLHALGCKKINLQVRSTNGDVVKFYERLGYSTENRISMGKRRSD